MIPTTTCVQTCEFRDADGALYTPTSVTATVRTPSGTTTVYTIANVYPPVGVTNPSTGVFKLKIDITVTGPYVVTWYGEHSTLGKVTQDAFIEL